MTDEEPDSGPANQAQSDLEAENESLRQKLQQAARQLAESEANFRSLEARHALLLSQGKVAGGAESGLEPGPEAEPELDLRKALERSHELLEGLGEAFFVLDRDWRFQYVSRKAAEIVGKTPGEMLGRALLEIFPEAEGGDSHRAFLKAVETDQPQHRESWSKVLGRWMEVDIQPGDNGLSVAFRDIHDRKVAEEDLKGVRVELAEDLSAMIRLNQLSTKLTAASALPALLQEVLDGTIELQHADFGKIQLYDAERDRLRIVAHRGFDAAFLEAFGDVTPDRLAGGEALKRRERIIIEDVQTDPRYARLGASAIAAGYRAVQSTPLLDHAGQLLGVLSTHFREPQLPSERALHLTNLFARQAADMIAAGLAQEALRESEQRFRAIVSQASVGICETGRDGRIRYVNDRYCEILGRDRQELLNLSLLDITYLDDLEKSRALLDRLFEKGDAFSIQKRYLRPDDSLVWVSKRVAPLRDAEGGIKGGLAVAIDINERKLAAEALVESERRLRSLIENIPQLVWRGLNGGEWTWSSPQWGDYTGMGDMESLGLGWLKAVHPEDQERAQSAWAEADDQGSFEVEYRIRRGQDQRYRFFQTRATPVRDEAGEVVEWFGTSTDIDDLRKLQEHQKLLVAELQHRVRNILAVVRSIARRTALTSDSAEEYAAHLDGRLNALARTQSVVTRDPLAGVDLEELVADEVLAHAARQDDHIVIDGPRVRLQAKAAETFSLAMHELATNAVKYGALSNPDGRIMARWSMTEDKGEPRLIFVWSETGIVVPSADHRRRGFGTELLERTLRYELGAETTLSFETDAVHCTIAMPVAQTLVPSDAAPN